MSHTSEAGRLVPTDRTTPEDIDEFLTVREVAFDWPGRRGRKLHHSAVYRFIEKGVAGVRLRAVVVPGSGTCTTRRWLSEFIAATNAARDGGTAPATRSRRGARPLLRDQLTIAARGSR